MSCWNLLHNSYVSFINRDLKSSTSIPACASSEGSGETARMRRLTGAFAARYWVEYQFLVIWLKCLCM